MVLEPLQHSVLDHADPAGQHAVVQDTLEPLEHLVFDTVLDCRPMEGITRPEPLEHTVLDTTLDGGLLEKMSDWEPVAHSVLDATLDGRPMERIPDPEPLEHSVLVMALDSECLEPSEQSVLNTALVAQPMEGTLDTDPSERSVHLDYGPLDSRPMAGIPDPDPLENSGLVMALDSGLKFTDAMREEALKIRAAVPVPAGRVGHVAMLPLEECTSDMDMCNNDISSEGFRCWNTDQDIVNQYETFNGVLWR